MKREWIQNFENNVPLPDKKLHLEGLTSCSDSIIIGLKFAFEKINRFEDPIPTLFVVVI